MTGGDLVQAERYLFRVDFPQDSFQFIFDQITEFELADTELFQAVLGINVLDRCDFEMLRNGTYRLRLG